MRQPKHGGTGRLAAPTFSMTAIVGLNHDTQTAHNITLLPFCTFYMMRTVNFFSLTKVDGALVLVLVPQTAPDPSSAGRRHSQGEHHIVMRSIIALLASAQALRVPTPGTAPILGTRMTGGVSMVAPAAEPVASSARKVMWEPNPATVEQTAMRRFQRSVGVEGGYEELWKWSVDNSDEFWTKLMDFVELQYTGSTSPAKEGR